MSIKLLFENIADAIKTKGGTSTTLTPAEMPRAILDLPTGSSTASGVTYDNTAGGLTANNVQDAIDELAEDVSTIYSDLSAINSTMNASLNNDLTITNGELIDGGYARIGNLVVVNLRVKQTSGTAMGIYKLPKYSGSNRVAILIMDIDTSSNSISGVSVKPAGSIEFNTSSNHTFVITGSYISE